MSVTIRLLDWIGDRVARRLSKPTSGYEPYAAARPDLVAKIIQPGDVLLVEGARSRINAAIRYLTQSTWSHAALYVGPEAGLGERDGRPLVLIEAELGKGVIASPLSKFDTYNTRICRPAGLTPEDRIAMIRYACERIGYAYDLKNIIDLMRYFLPQPPVPARWRRRMIALGSGGADKGNLLHTDRAGVRVGRLSDPAGGAADRRGEPPRNPAHPAPLSLCAARFRPVAVLRHREADHRDGIRLQGDDVGQGARERKRERQEELILGRTP